MDEAIHQPSGELFVALQIKEIYGYFAKD